MTVDELSAAIFAAGIGWKWDGGLAVAAIARPGYCNVQNCHGLAMAASVAGIGIPEIVAAVVAAADTVEGPGDRTLLNAVLASAKAMSQAIADVSAGWTLEQKDSADLGQITVWLVADRDVEARPIWEGTRLTTQAYRAQAVIAGATDADMAQALADLVAGDPAGFDLIMSA